MANLGATRIIGSDGKVYVIGAFTAGGTLIESSGTITTGSGGGPSGNVPVQIIKLGALNMTQNATRYAGGVGLAPAASEANATFTMPVACRISQLRAFANAAIPAAQSLVITVNKNTVATTITATMAAGQTTASDTTNSHIFSAGDKLSLKLVASATMTSTIDFNFSLIVEKAHASIGAGMIPVTNGASTANANLGETVDNATLANAEFVLPECTVVNAATTLQKNGAAHPGIANLSASLVASQRLYYAANDLIAIQGDSTNSLFLGPDVRAPDTTTYDPCPIVMTSLSLTQNTTAYMGGYLTSGDSGTENEVQIPMPACVLRNLRIVSSTAVAATSTVVTVRKNGSDSSVTATVTNASRQASDTTNSITFAAGDLLSIKVVSGATTGTRTYNATFELFLT